MMYNDATNEGGLINDIDFLVDTNSTNYPIKDKTRNMNAWYRRTIGYIWKACGDWDFDDSNHTGLPSATTALVKDQDDYALPSGYMNIDRVELKDASGIWTKLVPFDKTKMNMELDEFQKVPNIPMQYDLFANSLRVYPASNLDRAAALKIYFGRDIDEFVITDTTQEPGFNKNFHRILSYGAAFDYAFANGITKKVTSLRNEITIVKTEIEDYYKDRNADLAKTNMVMTPRVKKPAI